MDPCPAFVRINERGVKIGNMTRSFLFAAAVFLPVLAIAQTAPPRLEFEVASIRPAAPLDASVKIGMHIDGSQVRFTSLSVRDCMRLAWQVKDYQIVGPDWTGTDRWDITAKLPVGAKSDQAPDMLQKLLVDRFGITFHHDKREFAVYALVPAKGGLKLTETAPDAASDNAAVPKSGLNVSASGSAAGVFVDLGQGSWYSFADNKLVGHKLTMERIADALSRYMDKPVVDMTGAPANTYYDVSFAITADDYRTMLIRVAIRSGVSLPPEAVRLADAPTDSLAAAMEATGLRMESRKAPLDVMVIDHVEKAPTEN
jgi:uncharacterized protein (TIGR03435 family)